MQNPCGQLASALVQKNANSNLPSVYGAKKRSLSWKSGQWQLAVDVGRGRAQCLNSPFKGEGI